MSYHAHVTRVKLFLKMNSNLKKTGINKNLLIITPYFYPHLGGVEKHVLKTSLLLQQQGWQIKIITRQHDLALATQELVQGLSVNRFSFPNLRVLGLVVTWLKLLARYFRVFKQADIIQVHDVMVWCLLMRLLFPRKKFVLTVHGWEGVYPIPLKNIWLKQLSARLANKVICVGAFIKKYYGINCDQVILGAVADNIVIGQEKKKATSPIRIVYVGRLAKDTGLLMLLKAYQKLPIKVQQTLNLSFIGDGELRSQCSTVGEVLGMVDETKISTQLAPAHLCFASGYLSALEGLSAGCLVVVGSANQLKKDYWSMSELASIIKICETENELVTVLKQAQQLVADYDVTANSTWTKQYNWQTIAAVYSEIYSS